MFAVKVLSGNAVSGLKSILNLAVIIFAYSL
jgi:hypothetical protein